MFVTLFSGVLLNEIFWGRHVTLSSGNVCLERLNDDELWKQRALFNHIVMHFSSKNLQHELCAKQFSETGFV
jgi:hypothetical protein